MTQLIECIPNFSDARRPEVIDQIVAAIQSVSEVKLLDRSSDLDHNRTVVTFVGTPAGVEEAAFRAIKTASELIDLNVHTGAHPRMGATDVVPFVPLSDVTMEECIAIAQRLGQRVGSELSLPVYLYEAAATRPEHANLENIRRGQYEGLKSEIESDPNRKPDFGPAKLGTAGATTATNGTANTGGGGGASGISGVGTGSLKGGDGGSGVVVIRYVIAVAQFDASNYTAGTTTWANSITGGTAGTTATGGMTKTASGPTGVVFNGKESSNSDEVSSSIGSTTSIDTVTVEMWLKLKDSGSAQNASGSMLFSWGAGGYNIYHYGNQLGYNTFAAQLYGVDSTSYNTNWTHFVFVMTDTGDWSSQKIYVNGALQASTCRITPSACTNSQPRAFQSSGNFLLMNNAHTANTWNAKVDLGQVKVYNRELSSTQISANYSSSSASYVEADSTPPTFSNGTTFSFAENTSASTVAATISVNESSTISIVSGVDSALFSISAVDTVTGQVKFLTSPDFESALDVGANNVYNITIRAADTLGNSADQAISITVTNVNESSTMGAPTLSGAASKGSIVTITVTTNAAGKVRFFVSGKRIANCLARSTTGSYPNFSATCSWKPPVTGRQNLTARVTPTDSSFSATTSASTSVWVVKRSNSR